MPEYLYQYNLDTFDFIDMINNQIPTGDSVISIGSIFCPLVRIDVPATSETDLDELMASKGYTRLPPATPPTFQIAVSEMQLQIGSGPFSQIITSNNQKTNFWNQNKESTSGIITADQANNEITIDSLFNGDSGDRYDITVNVSVAVPRRDYCILSIIHDDNGSESVISEGQLYGQTNFGPASMTITGTTKVTDSVNQAIYVNVRTIGGSETIRWYAGNIIVKRV